MKNFTTRINVSYEENINGKRYYVDINTTNGVGAVRVGSNDNIGAAVGELFLHHKDDLKPLVKFLNECFDDFEGKYGQIIRYKTNKENKDEKLPKEH